LAGGENGDHLAAIVLHSSGSINMKAFAILAGVLGMAFSAFADATNIYENFAPHFSTNTEILWEAPTNHLPQSFWTYRRLLPKIFSQTVISNAIVLGSLQSKGFPKPSTNDFYISADKPPNWCCVIPSIFGIRPSDAVMYYAMPGYSSGSNKEIPNDAVIVAKAWKYAGLLGVDTSKLVQRNFFTYFNDTNVNPNVPANRIYGRGVFLSRKLDGITFFAGDDQGDGAEGFFVEFGNYGIIRQFILQWSDIAPYQEQSTASPQEIIQCIRAKNIMVMPNPNEEWYFERVKKLAAAKRFIISKITPYYMSNVFGVAPTDNEPSKYICPLAELDATADFGNSNATVRILSPITSSDVHRLLGK
jgi:hypothetical protein